MLTIRKAVPEDLAAVTDIYNQAILNTTATFDTGIKTPEEQKAWFEKHSARYPLLVAQQDNIIVGWASMSAWSDRCAYADTAEISLYVREEYQGKGLITKVAKALTDYAFNHLKLNKVEIRAAVENKKSRNIPERLGFVNEGSIRQAEWLYDHFVDHIVYGLLEEEWNENI